jgi:hypothetical protein
MSSSLTRTFSRAACLSNALLALLALLTISCASTTPSNDPGPAVPVVEYVSHQEVLTPLPLRVRMPAATNPSTSSFSSARGARAAGTRWSSGARDRRGQARSRAVK